MDLFPRGIVFFINPFNLRTILSYVRLFQIKYD